MVSWLCMYTAMLTVPMYDIRKRCGQIETDKYYFKQINKVCINKSYWLVIHQQVVALLHSHALAILHM